MDAEEMIYKERNEEGRKILYRGVYKDTVFFVVSYGTHPCAYVRALVPSGFIPFIRCHGGITYQGKDFDEFDDKGEYIGWDYNHFGYFNRDGNYSFGDYNGSLKIGGKKWTVSEIIEEAKEVIDFVLYAKKFDFDASKLNLE